jgi:hypothetical protein
MLGYQAWPDFPSKPLDHFQVVARDRDAVLGSAPAKERFSALAGDQSHKPTVWPTLIV